MIYAILLGIAIVTFFLGIFAGTMLERERWMMRDHIKTELERANYGDPGFPSH